MMYMGYRSPAYNILLKYPKRDAQLIKRQYLLDLAQDAYGVRYPERDT